MKQNAKKIINTILTITFVLGIFMTFNNAFAEDDLPIDNPDIQIDDDNEGEANPPEDTINQSRLQEYNQTVQLDNVTDDNWKPHSLLTGGLKFMIRGKEALAWTLNIKEAGFHNEAIRSSYIKVLTIVNSIFILGLLAIAAMWMFRIIIPRHYLRRVVLIYGMAVIFVNFAMPLVQLFIDGSNLLQKTFLIQKGESIKIIDIVETPTYNDDKTISYHNEATIINETVEKNINLAFDNETPQTLIIGQAPASALERPDFQGKITGGIASGDIELKANPIEKTLTFKTNQPLAATFKAEKPFDPHREQTIFTFIMIILTGIAYLMLALIFVLRIIILWALLILSPILFLLAIFNATRGYFYNWLSIYGRWLLIGPLAALGIAIIVNIWQTVGLPIASNYTTGQFAQTSYIAFLLPGSQTPNYLSTTNQMMEYIIFLLMLYLPIFFAFAFTRQKVWQGMTTAMVDRWNGTSKTTRKPHIIRTETTEENKRHQIETGVTTTPTGGIVDGVKNFFNTQITKITQSTVSEKLRTMESGVAGSIPSASNFLPEHLALTSIHDMMELIGAHKESRHSRETTLQKLATPELIPDSTERKYIKAVHQEITKRASQGDSEAIVILNEIQSKTNYSHESETISTGSTVPNERVATEKTIEHTPNETSVITAEVPTPQVVVTPSVTPETTAPTTQVVEHKKEVHEKETIKETVIVKEPKKPIPPKKTDKKKKK